MESKCKLMKVQGISLYFSLYFNCWSTREEIMAYSACIPWLCTQIAWSLVSLSICWNKCLMNRTYRIKWLWLATCMATWCTWCVRYNFSLHRIIAIILSDRLVDLESCFTHPWFILLRIVARMGQKHHLWTVQLAN